MPSVSASVGYYTIDYNGLFDAISGTTLTIGPGVNVDGELGVIGYSSPNQGSPADVVVNEGTIQADVSGGSITIEANGGAFQNSGTVNSSAGAISIETGSYGTVNSGTLAAGPTGTLAITGPYSQCASGTFDEVLGGSTTGLYGQTSISGTASLNGNLNVSEANGFSPSTGNIFTFLTYTSETGQFTNDTGLLLSDSTALQPAFSPTSVTLTTVINVVQATPTSVYVASSYAADAPGTVVTWSDGSTHTVGFDAFGTIQAGITAVAAGGAVNVAPGTYTEQLTIDQNLSLIGAGVSSATIQAPMNSSGNEIEISAGVTVTMSGLNVDGASTSTAIDVNGGDLSASSLAITGYNVGISVENAGAVTVTDSTITSDATGILVGSGESDTCTVTAANDSFAGDTTGVQNNQTAGSPNATLNWWGSPTGPASASNPGGTGAAAAGNVSFIPWLGDANIVAPDYLVFLSTTGDQYAVTANSGNTALQVTLDGGPVGSVSGGDTLAFTGSGGTVTINGETGVSSSDVLDINDTSVQFAAADSLAGSTIDFTGTAITRNVDAQGTVNTFNIQGAGASGPSGSLVGDTGTNAFVFSGLSKLIGDILGAGSSTLDFSAYGSGVTVKLGNGTNGTATGASSTVAGITAVIGSAFNDTLKAGTVPGVALTGGLGINALSGTGAGDSVVESISSIYTLAKGSLTGTGSASFTDNLTGIKVATLSGSSATSNSFTVSGWTGSGSLSSPAGTGSVTASKSNNFTLSDTSLSAGNGMSLSLSGIATADLTISTTGHTFTETGWTGSGSLTGTSATVAASNPSGFTLTPNSLTAGPMSFSLSGVSTANLTDTSGGGNAFDITGWTGKGTFTGSSETLVDSVAAKTTLTNTSLAVTGNPTLTLAGFTAADLTDSTGGNTFVVSGWTGGGSLQDTGSSADTVTASKSEGFTLTDGSLSSTDGMNLTLGGITTANLTDSGSGGNSFIVSGWTGTGTLKGTAETLVDSVAAGVTLANSSLAVTGGATLTLNGFTTANLTDSAGGNTFTVGGWTGGGSLADTAAGGDIVAATKSSGYTLADNSLASTDGMSLVLSGITTADLTATSAGKTFDVSAWTGSGSLTDTAATGDTVTATKSASMTLTGSSFSSTDGMTLTLSNFKTATLTVTASSGNPSYVVDASAFTGVTNLTAGGTANAILFGGSTSGSTLERNRRGR